MQTAFSTDGARSPCRRPRHRKPPSSRSPVREAREAAWQAACRSPPISAPRRAAASGSQAQAAQRSGTVGLAGAWVKSPPPVHRVPGRHRGASRPPNRLQPPPPSRPSRAGCPSPAISSVRALRASLRPTGCRQGCASALGPAHVVLSAMPSGSAPSLPGHHAHPRLTLP